VSHQSLRTGESSDELCERRSRRPECMMVVFEETTRQRRGVGLAEMESRNDNQRVIVALHRNKLDGAILRCRSIATHSGF
jgi:hypothetical protein